MPQAIRIRETPEAIEVVDDLKKKRSKERAMGAIASKLKGKKVAEMSQEEKDELLTAVAVKVGLL